MTIICTLLMQIALATTKAAVHGTLPAGAKLEFLTPGSPDRLTAQAGEKGAYSIVLVPGRYELTYVTGTRRVAAMVWIAGDTEINGLPEAKGKVENASGQEYDLLADWRVVDKNKRGVGPSRVALEAELSNGRSEKLTLWALSGIGDEEKETNAPFETTPDGRVLFRVRESHLRSDRVTAMRVRVEAPGHPPLILRIQPVLEFAETGHFHAVYPEQYEMILQ
jgi:hypothetical protein